MSRYTYYTHDVQHTKYLITIIIYDEVQAQLHTLQAHKPHI